MTRARGLRYARVALVTLGLACGDSPTAPNAASETVLVSLAGISSGDAGIVLELIGAADDIQAASASLEVAWVRSATATNMATVAIIGPLAEVGNVLAVTRRAGLEPLRVDVREVAAADGTLSSPSPARAFIRVANSS